MAIYDNIRATFETELNSISGLPSIAWENVSFEPTTGQSYLKLVMIPTLRKPSVMGTTPQVYYQGYFLVNCCVPEGNGPGVADDLADTILTNLEVTSDIEHNNLPLRIRFAERDMGYQEGSHYCVPVRIGWYTYFPKGD